MNKTLNGNLNFFDYKVLGHPAGLFVLFFTEMWERFSFYGMRVLLINFLTVSIIGYNPGWGMPIENAVALFGTYAMLLYITPIFGGIIADKVLGYRLAVIIGSIIMTLGHISMALETHFSLYIGLGLLVIGTGFFKPNLTSIISEIYKDLPEKKDGAYTIFYMGVNSGAFFGTMLCGYLAERIGWSWGFGLAGVFMLLGTLQFWLAKPLFGEIGNKPNQAKKINVLKYDKTKKIDSQEHKLNPFTKLDKILIFFCGLIGLAYAINDPLYSIANINLFPFEIIDIQGQYIATIVGLIVFLYLVISRIIRYTVIIRDRMLAIIIFAFFTVIFWMAFEQAASSLVLFARDSINRSLTGNWVITFNIINALLTVIPLSIITWVLILLAKRTSKLILKSNIVLFICFTGVWAIVGWMLNRDFSTIAYDVTYRAIEKPILDKTGSHQIDEKGLLKYKYEPVTESTDVEHYDKIVERTVSIAEPVKLNLKDKVKIIAKDKQERYFGYLNSKRLKKLYDRAEEFVEDIGVIEATVTKVKDKELEINVSWFSILNSFFIIAFASIFSRWWDSKYDPSVSIKYGLGLIITSVGFGLLAVGSYGVTQDIKVSIVWLILAYLFHTLGELCLSPVGLSYISKLVPPRIIAFMFGMWYLAIAIGNKLAAVFGGKIETISHKYSLSGFFLIFTVVLSIAGLVVILLNPVLKKLMHGVK